MRREWMTPRLQNAATGYYKISLFTMMCAIALTSYSVINKLSNPSSSESDNCVADDEWLARIFGGMYEEPAPALLVTGLSLAWPHFLRATSFTRIITRSVQPYGRMIIRAIHISMYSYRDKSGDPHGENKPTYCAHRSGVICLRNNSHGKPG